MILNDKQLEVQSSGIASSQFSIALNKKMFSILSSGIYSNPIKSILREVGCNAYDAHIAAGKKDLPFEIHLPNSLEPFFEIKDFGTGIPNDQILDIYTKYGNSTKTDTNDQVGAFGLGSKSPFSYTDNFTVENRYNGTKTSYTAFLNKDGFPAFSEAMSAEKTNECNGLTVRFPVKQSDNYRFSQEAKEVYKWFKVRPIVKGEYNFTFPAEKLYLRKTDLYGMPQSRSAAPHIVMGNVAYPIAINNIVNTSDYVKPTWYKKVNSILQWGLELYCSIGDVEITASREQLSYGTSDGGDGKKTVDFIRKKCEEVYDELERELTKGLKEKKNIWEARIELTRIRNSWYDFDFDGTWNGQKITAKIPLEYNKVQIKLNQFSRKTWGKQKVYDSTIHDFLPQKDLKIYVLDCHGGLSRIKYLVETTGQSLCYFPDTPDQKWIDENAIPIVNTSTLPVPPKQVGTRSAAAKAKIYQYDRTGLGAVVNYWKPAEIDLSAQETFVYVNILFFKYKDKNGVTQYPNGLTDYLNSFDRLKHPIHIYGIRPSDENVIKKSKGTWIKLFDYVDLKQKEWDKLYLDKALNNRRFNNFLNRIQFEKLSSLSLDKTSEMGKFIDKYNKCKESAYDPVIQNYISLHTDQTKLEIPKDTCLNNDFAKILNKYKVLKCINWSHDNKKMCECIKEYIQIIDKLK